MLKHAVCAFFWLALFPVRLSLAMAITLLFPVWFLMDVSTSLYRWSCKGEELIVDFMYVEFICGFWCLLITNNWDYL